ncbi:YcgL domain-containing protein [Serratia microhaemolytica]|uniref:YcgL domain-containing protein n=1 Tax=Serratia microhaemolytica TaxID=2675110 RepID=UPI000FDDA811|nr:YcgL domain-containing protein [Serratia microhaemolytica]
MHCAIYRSSKREQTYLYIEQKDDFSRVPAELIKSFGVAHFVMTLALDGGKKLAAADNEVVKQALTQQGFYLQLPPPVESLLNSHSMANTE